jgi:membrane-bound lytic murein transglycosylase D
MRFKWVTIAILSVAILIGPLLSAGLIAAEPFPKYEVIKPNVSFWIKIYSHYPSTRAIVHDSDDLDIIYDVIDLEPAEQPGSRKINRRRMKAASRRYESILKRLAADPLDKDADCRRVAALFGPTANTRTFRRASQRVRCQIGQRDRFETGMVRSGAYLEKMRTILSDYGIPPDLAYLPHVESSFNSSAFSKFGAAGIWQFTRSTGLRFLTVDYVLDERRDPFAATRAAAQLLKDDYDKLGSWPLAITAYNHGAVGMLRAKEAYGDYASIFANYRGRTFKFASRNFYSEFLAARQVASHYVLYFVHLTLANPLRTRTVNLDGFVALKDLCRYFKVSPRVIRTLNPALRSPVFSGQKYVPEGYALNLPASSAAGNAITVAQIPSDLLKGAQKPSRFYTVQRGDTAGKIARMNHVALRDLMLANDLDRHATVYARQTLRIPQPGESKPIGKGDRPPAPADTTLDMATADTPDTPPARQLPVENTALRFGPPEPSGAHSPGDADSIANSPPQASNGQGAGIKPEAVSIDIGFAGR